MGMCFGVRDAIALAMESARHHPLTVLGELVHNDAGLAELRDRGVQFQNHARDVATRDVMITAHGASQRSMEETRAAGLRVIEGTCPLVHQAHQALGALVAEGYFPVIIGQRGHVEVRGMTGDLGEHAAYHGIRASY